ncbi:hypothetical protein COY93_04135 [Candidatus Uhrbacteria bacterium CG_4_10_14_0_8_um_filter_58_22]|uniref:Uncharacterized protein n=1 Tax=Candidatus Uhrbacteria bacterium CG_4_10_14_0_8_um_filter_58_22 TaxID=1975029 RepID=A0A2M7QA21_9BACT|nr:MAG: hypothetical protein AUJ19_04825 [Parcubacteria group bacterium CG1_02_58_44]PIY62029.1 MAG: hypothetical protein COY93_04135 [Candidatus Uhrbacteria bacterium CG_4_10_14_0_8_um_filter_58_22]
MIWRSRGYGEGRLERLFGLYSRKAELAAVLSLVILLAHWSFLLWFSVSRLGTLKFLRLHYTAALGVDWIDSWWKIFVFPGFGLATFLVNAVLSGRLARSHRLFGLVIMWTTVFLEMVFAVGGVMAVLLNG